MVNYWSKSLPDPEIGSTNIYCDCGEGLVVGLDTNDDFYINVQVFTNGGMGPLSEEGDGGTYIFPPLAYPEYVQVTSFPGNSVFVFWRSVTTGLLEEPVAGYKLRWWPAGDNILTANDTVVPGGLTHGVIRGLRRGVVYSLRVLGYSAAGDGKRSPTVFFTLEGRVRINPETSELMNASSRLNPCVLIRLLAVVNIVLRLLSNIFSSF
ncbi:hypothetical protein EGW08_007553 [Elysia chlorotica]|uniref:Fibronectin type-III domain-containing protein n=1 Tax=Elysia chlorotica TaxID=188477 RepID=A0A3S1HRF8_ELYCH|nr:hypothetical protein EGW08_007553 [Elysia chlorotica]